MCTLDSWCSCLHPNAPALSHETSPCGYCLCAMIWASVVHDGSEDSRSSQMNRTLWLQSGREPNSLLSRFCSAVLIKSLVFVKKKKRMLEVQYECRRVWFGLLTLIYDLSIPKLQWKNLVSILYNLLTWNISRMIYIFPERLPVGVLEWKMTDEWLKLIHILVKRAHFDL